MRVLLHTFDITHHQLQKGMPAGPVATAQPRKWVKAGGDCDDAGRCRRSWTTGVGASVMVEQEPWPALGASLATP